MEIESRGKGKELTIQKSVRVVGRKTGKILHCHLSGLNSALAPLNSKIRQLASDGTSISHA